MHLNVFATIYQRGLYTLSFSDPLSSTMASTKIQETSALHINQCSSPLSLDARETTITFNAESIINTAQIESEPGLFMENQRAERIIVYLQISIPEQYRKENNQNIVLTWVLEAKQKINIRLYTLKCQWEDIPFAIEEAA